MLNWEHYLWKTHLKLFGSDGFEGCNSPSRYLTSRPSLSRRFERSFSGWAAGSDSMLVALSSYTTIAALCSFRLYSAFSSAPLTRSGMVMWPSMNRFRVILLARLTLTAPLMWLALYVMKFRQSMITNDSGFTRWATRSEHDIEGTRVLQDFDSATSGGLIFLRGQSSVWKLDVGNSLSKDSFTSKTFSWHENCFWKEFLSSVVFSFRALRPSALKCLSQMSVFARPLVPTSFIPKPPKPRKFFSLDSVSPVSWLLLEFERLEFGTPLGFAKSVGKKKTGRDDRCPTNEETVEKFIFIWILFECTEVKQKRWSTSIPWVYLASKDSTRLSSGPEKPKNLSLKHELLFAHYLLNSIADRKTELTVSEDLDRTKPLV